MEKEFNITNSNTYPPPLKFNDICTYILLLEPELSFLIEYANKIKPAKKGEIKQLQYKIIIGDNVARLRLIEINIRFAIRIGFRYAQRNNLDVTDLIQDAISFMIEGLDKYAHRENNFKPSLYRYINNKLAEKYSKNTFVNEFDINDLIIYEDLIFERIEQEEVKLAVNIALSYLTQLEQKVIRLRFGLDDGSIQVLDEVARSFGVTRERARQIEAKAIRKLHSQKILNLFKGNKPKFLSENDYCQKYYNWFILNNTVQTIPDIKYKVYSFCKSQIIQCGLPLKPPSLCKPIAYYNRYSDNWLVYWI